jgi:hypothetical protein
MKGYLLKEQDITIGEDLFIQVDCPENNYTVVFEDDTDTGYFYAAERSPQDASLRILDMLHIYDADAIKESARNARLAIVWSSDWECCALVLDNVCHALFEFKNQGGYNLTEFPPPNSIWTRHGRKLTTGRINDIFK